MHLNLNELEFQLRLTTDYGVTNPWVFHILMFSLFISIAIDPMIRFSL